MIANYRPPDSLPATVLRTRSLMARRLLAHAASGGSASLAELIEMARVRQVRPRAWQRRLRVGALCDLARVLALQDALPDDLTDGLALLDYALKVFGPDGIEQKNQGVHAQLAYHLGDHQRAAALLQTYADVPEAVRDDLRLDLANPFGGCTVSPDRDWLNSFQSRLPPPGLVLHEWTDRPPLDRVTARRYATVTHDQLVTVIVTAFKPGPPLITAVRSIVDQSWANTEIIIVDDGSPPEFDPVLGACLELDGRIRLVKLGVNTGTYGARNAGLDEAAGAFVTFQDSDDWSHPGRIERQVRPLIEDSYLVATVSDGLRVSDHLTLTRPGRDTPVLNTSSLMVRKAAALDRIGYFDGLRKAADSEYLARILAGFGRQAVYRTRGELYALLRQTPGSLSRAEVRAGWMHPARVAYRSAYEVWHERIRGGEAAPFVPREFPVRRFPVAAHLSGTPKVDHRRCYDVLFVSDWREFGGSQRSMYDQIRALARSGRRVGLLHMESFLLMAPYRKLLCRPVQDLVNDGIADRVLLSERVDAGLVVIQPPPVLQFPPSTASTVRARQALIIASTAPAALDGRDRRYSAPECTESAMQLFGAQPLWCPTGQAVRAGVEAELAPAEVAQFEFPSIINVDEWLTDRRYFRSNRPVVGRHARDHWTKWPSDEVDLFGAYPRSANVDVRVRGGTGIVRAKLGTGILPANWLAYEKREVPIRTFLFQVDFFSHFLHPLSAELYGRATLEALAAGCVTFLPHSAASAYEDAAICCKPAEVQEVVNHFYSERAAYRRQSVRATEWVRDTCQEKSYVELVSALV